MKISPLIRHHSGLFFLLCCGLSLACLWPGSMSDDSISTYQTALTLSYQRGLGPLLQMVWWLSDQVIKGSGGMLILQMSIYWAAVYFFAQSFLRSKWFWWFVGVLFWPSLWVSMGYIWKDLYFVFIYLLVGGYLTYLLQKRKSLGVMPFIGLCMLLLWATSIKYQAQFVLFFPLLWMCSLINLKTLWAKVGIAVLITFSILGAIEGIHQLLIPSEKELHKWQSVKIYDLAGISVNAGKNVVPPFLFKEPTVTLENIQNKYSHLWEPLIDEPDSPLRFAQTDEERQQLKASWWNRVGCYPGSYLKHRTRVLYKTLSGTDVKYPLRRFLKAHNLPTWPANLGILFSYLLGLPLSLFYIVLAYRSRQFWAAGPLLYLNGMAVVYASFLFVFSLASTSRYVYFCVACLAFSHPFAYLCWRFSQGVRRKRNGVIRG